MDGVGKTCLHVTFPAGGCPLVGIPCVVHTFFPAASPFSRHLDAWRCLLPAGHVIYQADVARRTTPIHWAFYSGRSLSHMSHLTDRLHVSIPSLCRVWAASLYLWCLVIILSSSRLRHSATRKVGQSGIGG